MSGFLAQACAEARERVAEAARAEPLESLRRRAGERAAPRGFAAALGGSGVAVIAEVKRASPSRGPMAAIADPAALAGAYARGGAAAVSVLTEPAHFAGSLGDLTAVAEAVPLPVLRKDFVVDSYQVWEARAAGAAAVLLIVAGLEQAALVELLGAAEGAGLDALVEVHNRAEARRATQAHAEAATGRALVVGVNARDLTTLEIDLDRFAGIVGGSATPAGLPPGALTVAESGIRGAAEVRRLAHLGADAVLVGEHVATAVDPAAAVGELVAAGARQEARR